MIAGLDRRFAKLEKQRQTLIARLAPLSVSTLTSRPALGSWSALEIVDHLYKTEHSILHIVSANLAQSQTAAQIRLRDKLGATCLITLFLLPTRVKIPASAAQVLPAESPDLNAVLQLWSSTRNRLATVLEAVPHTAMSCGVFRHPVSGWMTTTLTMDFLSAHIVHHGYQLDRLKSALHWDA